MVVGVDAVVGAADPDQILAPWGVSMPESPKSPLNRGFLGLPARRGDGDLRVMTGVARRPVKMIAIGVRFHRLPDPRRNVYAEQRPNRADPLGWGQRTPDAEQVIVGPPILRV